MHTYNPLELPEIITNIVYNLALEDLNRLCWINGTWYKQVQQELRKRCENQMVKYYKKCRKRDNEIKKSNKIISVAYHDFLISNLLKYSNASTTTNMSAIATEFVKKYQLTPEMTIEELSKYTEEFNNIPELKEWNLRAGDCRSPTTTIVTMLLVNMVTFLILLATTK
jgi:hypothetical protein